MIPDLPAWDLTLLATDINPEFLRRASEGVFSEWAFRDVPPDFKEKYFVPEGRGRYRINLAIKRLVTFDYLNLAEDVYPSLLNNTNGMDVIFCRNVLIYLDAAHVTSVFRRLGRCLTPNGWLLVAPPRHAGGFQASWSAWTCRG